MSVFSVKNVELKAIAACVPKNEVLVLNYPYFSANEYELFTQNTGIFTRRFAPDHICTSDMCYHAAEQLIADNQINREEIDIVIFVSQSPDYFLPATSVLLQNRLQLPKTTMAFDINLGCSGYIYGLSVLANLLSGTGLKKGLLLCGDKSSTSLNIQDKSTYPLFGDAGTATLLEFNEHANRLFFNLQSDGSGEKAIIIPGGGTRNPYSSETLVEKEIEPGIVRCDRDLALDGIEVFNFSLREVKPNILELFEFANFTENNIDYFVMHQANKLMNESVRKKLKFPSEKTPYSLSQFGNTSSASIPLTMVTELRDELTKPKCLLLSGFGVGLSWGSAIVRSNSINVSKLVEI
jgi:3-oxoacyl-[acyl-carrier-protein] synthase III